jgi:hypothetical protein
MSHFQHILKGIVSQSSGVDADLAVYLASLTTPLSAGQITKLNTFVTSLKNGMGITNLSDAFDALYIFANETSEAGLKNIVKRAHDATLSTTAPAFTALEGFKGNGSSSFINSNYNPNTQKVNYSLNSASFGLYSRTDRLPASKISGVSDGNLIDLRPYFALTGQINIIRGFLHSTNGKDMVVNNSLGLSMIHRQTNTNINASRNATLDIARTDSTTGAIPNGNIYFLARNQVGSSPINSADIQISIGIIAKDISSNIAVVYNAIQAYMTSNGKQV